MDSEMNSNEVKKQDKKLIPFRRVFRYARWYDYFMMIFGTITSIIFGIAMPCTTLVFGVTINEFVAYSMAKKIIDAPWNESIQLNCNGSAQTKLVIDYLESNNLNNKLQLDIMVYSWYYFILALTSLVCAFLSIVLWSWSAQNQAHRIRRALFKVILHKNIEWFDVNPSAELNGYLSKNIENIEEGMGLGLCQAIKGLSIIITGVIIAFVQSWQLSLVCSIILPAVLLTIVVSSKLMTKFSLQAQKPFNKAAEIAEEVLSCIRTVVAFGGEEHEINRYHNLLQEAYKPTFKKLIVNTLLIAIYTLILFESYFIALWFGSFLYSKCQIRPGDIFVVLFSLAFGWSELNVTIPNFLLIVSCFSSATAVFTVLDEEKEEPDSFIYGQLIPKTIHGKIEFCDIVFHYPSRPDIPVLRGIDFMIVPGQTVALVGASGCGKSTVLQLLLRFYNLREGKITLDGYSLTELDVKWLRSKIGVVTQESNLFDDTILENIKYGKENATMGEIEEAARTANIYDFICELPDGFNTVVGKRGTKLSGGQKQRIAIARALVRNPKILLLDEATSALDKKCEKTVQEALDKAREGRTTIIIAHRLSSIQTADVIVGIKDGRVIEMGTHSQLMSSKGLYYKLVLSQRLEEKENAEGGMLEDFNRAVRESLRRELHAGRSDSHLREHEIISSVKKPVKLKQCIPASDIVPVDVSDLVIQKTTLNTTEKELTTDSTGDNGTGKVSILTILKLAISEWRILALGIITSLIFGAAIPISYMIFGIAIMQLSEPDFDEMLSDILHMSAFYVLIGIGGAIVQGICIGSLGTAELNLAIKLRTKCFTAMLEKEMAWFDQPQNSVGALTTLLIVDISVVSASISGFHLGDVLKAFSAVIVTVVLSFNASWAISMIVLLGFPFLFAIGLFQLWLIQTYALLRQEKLVESAKIANEAIDNIHTVISLGIEESIEKKYSKKLCIPLRTRLRKYCLHGIAYGLSWSLNIFLFAVSYNLGTYLVISDPNAVYHIEYGDMFKIFAMVYASAFLLKRVFLTSPDLLKAHLSAKPIAHLLKKKSQKDANAGPEITLENVKGEISMKSLSFSYPTRPELPVLQNLSISIEPGKTLAMLGPSGSGKSTVVSLIERFYDPTSGVLSLDGENICLLNVSWLRRQISLVPQEPVLFDMSIDDNIRYGANYKELSDEEIIEAAKAANIHDFIQTLPQGYDTNVGSKGMQLSGGQKQRIAIARALVRNPKILLLDEATSALDTESEKIVQEALDKARDGRTTIIIAHRLSTISNADNIAVLHRGTVIEQGTHSQLMNKKGAYYFMNNVQELFY